MKVLFDAVALVWPHAEDRRVAVAVRRLLLNASAEVPVSAAGAWEIATKARLGKRHGVQRVLSDFAALAAADHFTLLPMTHAHAALAGGFDVDHRDPFDRMLAAQALIEQATLLTSDAEFSSFGVTTRW